LRTIHKHTKCDTSQCVVCLWMEQILIVLYTNA